MHIYPSKKQTNHHERRELTAFEKRQIVEGKMCGNSYTAIGKDLGIHRSTIASFWQRSQIRRNIKNKSRSDRPRGSSTSKDQYLISNAMKVTHQPWNVLP